jgi:hypothetical protein
LTGARRVYPVHYDDFTQPLGDIKLLPRIADNVVKAAMWLNELAANESDPVVIQRLSFGVAVTLY